MKPGKFFEKWYFHHNTILAHGYEEDYRRAFEKGREYEKKHGKGTWKSKAEAMKYLVRRKK